MYFLMLLVLALAGAGLHVRRQAAAMPRRKAELVLLWLLVGGVGMGGVVSFGGHLLDADGVAAAMGWPRGTPFQDEVAFANLALGVLGLLCLRAGAEFWRATGIAAAIYHIGAAIALVKAAVAAGVVLPGTVVLLPQLMLPVLLLALLAVQAQLRAAELDPWLRQRGLGPLNETAEDASRCISPTRPTSTWSSTPSPTSGSPSVSSWSSPAGGDANPTWSASA